MRTIIFREDLPLTSGFGLRSIEPKFHRGLDFGTLNFGSVDLFNINKAAYVYLAGFDKWMGNYVWLRHTDGSGSRYMHLSRLDVATGQYVAPGQLIGKSGATGNVTGAHVHYEYLQNYAAVDTAIDPTQIISISHQPQKMDANKHTVRPGEGWSHIALEAGYADWDTETRWNALAQLNGFSDHKATVLQPGQVVVVRSTTETSTNASQREIDILKAQVQEKEAKYKAELEKAAAESFNKLEATKVMYEKERAELEIKYKAELEKATAEIAKTKEEYKTNFKQVLEVGNIHATSLVADIAEQTLSGSGILSRWASLVDRNVKSQTLKSILKYDIFVVVGIVLSLVITVGVAPLAKQYLGIEVSTEVAVWISLVAGVGQKLLLTRYDSNKDGKFDITDTQELAKYSLKE